MSDQEKEVLMAVGKNIITDIKALLKTVSPKTRTEFTHAAAVKLGGSGTEPVRTLEIVLLFSITELGGTDELELRTFIYDRLLHWVNQPATTPYKLRWQVHVKVPCRQEVLRTVTPEV
jgi:hypothetical protein